MRLPIAYEGEPTGDGRTIKVLDFTHDPYPLTALTVGRGLVIIGKATDVQRTPGGTITADIEIPLVGHAPQIEVDQLEPDPEDDMCFAYCRLRSVHLGMDPAWPDLLITNETREWTP